MARRDSYQTTQKTVLQDYLQQHCGHHFTVPQLKEELEALGINIGLATIYRQLDQMVQDNSIRKYTPDGKQAYYEYVGSASSPRHYHLRCIHCGTMQHLEERALGGLPDTVWRKSRFSIDPTRTILCGVCEGCLEKGPASAEK